MQLLLSVHLPVAAVMSDVCDYLDVVDDDVTLYYNDSVGQVLKGCLDNERLVEILGLDEQLAFADNIEFPELGDIASDSTFSEFSNFSDGAQSVDFSTFLGPGDEALDGLNQLIAECLAVVEVEVEVAPSVMATLTVYDYPPCADHGGLLGDRFSRHNFSEIDPADYYDRDSEYSEIQWEAMANLTDVLFMENLTLNLFEV